MSTTKYVLAARLITVSDDVMNCLDKVYITYVAVIGRECAILTVSKDGSTVSSTVGIDNVGYVYPESVGPWHPMYNNAYTTEDMVNVHLERLLYTKNKETQHA